MDSRFYLKVSFEIYGKKFKWEPSLNYFDRGDGMDQRIFDWFAQCYKEAHEEYQEQNYEYARNQEKKKQEDNERKELARLKAKYEA